MECDIQDRYICEYDIGPSCPREGDAPDAACSCLSGHFSCYNDCDDDSVTADEGGSDDDSVTEGGSDDDSVSEDDSVPDDDVSDSGEDGDSESGGVSDTAHVGEANGDGNDAASKNGDNKPKKDRGGKMNSKTGARGHKKGEKRNLRRVIH